jgi:pimeloyl-ACP methyl ester carboxylesterase
VGKTVVCGALGEAYSAAMETGAYAAVNGLQMYYEVHGDGPPLVLLHGGALTIELSFGRVIPSLAEHHRVIAVELQGHGHTADIDRAMSPAAFADDVISLLDQLGVDRTDFLGYSLGGCVCLEIATRQPGLAGKLVLVSTPTCRADFAFDGQLPVDRMPTAADGALWEAEYRSVAPDPDGFPNMIEKASTMVRAIPDWTPEQLRPISAPTLLLIGDRDFISVERALEVRDLIPDAQLAVLPDATHVEVMRRPAQLLALVTPFLSGMPVAG